MRSLSIHMYMCVAAFLLLAGCERVSHSIAIEPQELREVGKLELLEHRTEEVFVISRNQQQFSNIRSLQDAADYFDSLLKVGERIGVYAFDYYTVAYIDLYQLQPEDVVWNEAQRAIRLTLPPIEIEPIGKGGSIRLLHERVNGMQDPITPQDRQRMQNQAVALAKRQLLPGTPKHEKLVAKAETKARAYFTSMLLARGCQQVEISFKER